MHSDGKRYAANSLCTQRGLRTKATVTNHIVSPKQGGSFDDEANHESLCRACNTRHAIAHEGAFANRIG
jgi:5-methylcytosine-specific restriction endonuclease McrA